MTQREFNFTGDATARNSDPETSHMAADRMNADNGKLLNRHQRIVLQAVHDCPGFTSKELGGYLVCHLLGNHDWPHKRSRELELQLYVYRYLPAGESQLRVYITPRGIKKLKFDKPI